jgi:hypothetical protein
LTRPALAGFEVTPEVVLSTSDGEPYFASVGMAAKSLSMTSRGVSLKWDWSLTTGAQMTTLDFVLAGSGYRLHAV